jgi:hypothetical protein
MVHRERVQQNDSKMIFYTSKEISRNQVVILIKLIKKGPEKERYYENESK